MLRSSPSLHWRKSTAERRQLLRSLFFAQVQVNFNMGRGPVGGESDLWRFPLTHRCPLGWTALCSGCLSPVPRWTSSPYGWKALTQSRDKTLRTWPPLISTLLMCPSESQLSPLQIGTKKATYWIIERRK